MKITVLTENTTTKSELICEHGLSLYIETDNHKILFDMGKSDAFYHNALHLGIDLSKVDIAILSHGHYDHGGGLETFLTINTISKVYISPFAFEPHYSSNGYIGLDISLKDNPRLCQVCEIITIDNLTITPASMLPAPYTVEHFGLTANNNTPDCFLHEQYLSIFENGRHILVSGCSHKGILNITDYFKPDIVIGGFHFMKIEPNEQGIKKLFASADILKQNALHYYTCHCTGIPQYEKLKGFMEDSLFYISTGDIFSI